ncbi:Synaptic vesicle glycoprotein 2B [Atta colombica]|uniref:Synaptic vesicle glycoprotein 2B n=1 Tax=Atta colombica TaxID=520822 RepID=A0A195B1S0_9HYME|nr:PREDICTED: synaptic vesicle glycoprotein 2B [Atta colombica]KYM78421.1 Synaptic vesicle glycoprotein 2B [Atta colombica]
MVSRISTISLSIEKETKDHGIKEGTADFEKAMEICGNGRYQYTFLLVCGVMFICVGCQFGASAYILPSAECDLNMKSEEKGLLNVAFLAGSVFSALFWGVFAGAYGRRNILLITLFGDSIVTLITSFLQNFELLLAFRVISGFLMGGPGSLIYMYLGESHAEKYRAKSICYLGFFFTLAWLILPGLAWIIIPLPISFNFYGIQYNSWRLFLGAISIPTFIIAIITLTYPESPKFLVSQGKTDEALMILQTIYAVNTGRDKNEFPVKELLSDAMFEVEKDKEPLSSSDMLMKLLKNIWWQLRTTVTPPILKYASLLWIIYFTNMFGYYAFNLWQPELFNRFEKYHQSHPNVSVTVCELIHESQMLNHTVPEESFPLLTNKSTTECKPHIDERVFINSLIINAVSLFGNVASGYLANRVSRRTMPVTTLMVAAIASFGMYFVRSSLQILITACVFTLMAATTNFVITSVAVDIFPTHVSAAAVSMMVCLGRFGAVTSNLAFGMLLDLSCEIPIFLVVGITTFGGLLCFLIPSKEKK